MAGLGGEGQRLVRQPEGKPFEIAGGRRVKSQKLPDRTSMASTLARIQFERGEAFDANAKLRGNPRYRGWGELVMTLREPAVQLHELELHRKREAPFVGHAGEQLKLLGRQCP